MANKGTLLNTEKAIEIRRRVRNNTYGSLEQLGKEYGVHGNTIIAVIRGRTFREVNHIEPPIEYALINSSRVKRDNTPPAEYIEKLLKMRKANPKKWTFKALAAFMKEDSSYSLSKFRLSELMVKQDPTLSKKRPRQQTPYVRHYNRICVICEEPFKSKTRTTEVCFNTECRTILEMELAYDRNASR